MADRSLGAMQPVDEPGRISTGNSGLDEILAGDLGRHWLYLIEGCPGTGRRRWLCSFC